MGKGKIKMIGTEEQCRENGRRHDRRHDRG
jgi:hypothetical protein